SLCFKADKYADALPSPLCANQRQRAIVRDSPNAGDFYGFRDAQSAQGRRRSVCAMNLLGPALVRDLVSLIQGAEADDTVKALVFKSTDSDYFIAHVDVTQIKEYRAEAAKLTGEASIGLVFRHLSASRLVTIAQIEGRDAAGSEFVLACDMRFAARE